MLGLVMALVQGAAPLPPIDAWSVSQANGMCILSRPFGDRASPVVLAIRQTPLDDDGATIIIVDKAPPVDRRFFFGGKVKVALAPGGGEQQTIFQQGTMKEPGRRFIIFGIEQAMVAGLPKRGAITVKIDREPRRSFPLATVAGARNALRQCNDALLRRWEIDPAETSVVKTQAVPSSKSPWKGFRYPADALKAGQRGTTTIAWRVTTQGLIESCRVVESSGHVSLDRAACVGVEAIGRYKPALGQDDNVVSTHQVRRVNWVLPIR